MRRDVGRNATARSLDDLLPINAHVRRSGIRQDAHHSVLAGEHPFAQLVFKIVGVGLPGFPD